MLEDGQKTVQYEYDNSGNLIKKITGIGSNAETAHYRYDGYNRLSEFIDDYSTAEYSYNINGLRESKTVNGVKTRYIYNQENIIGEIFDDNIYTYYRATELIGYTNNKGDRYYYRQNSHGDVTALLTVDGQEKKAYSYSAYGKEIPFSLAPMGSQTVVQLWRAETEQIHNPFRYCGEYYDQETGFIYLRNRYYDNSTGRFITEDPIKDGLNWYVYCGNNPIRYIDPFGLTITLNGTEDEMLRSFNQLQALTNDELSYDKETGNVTIVSTGTINTDRTLKAGSKLVSDLIANDDFNVTIVRINVEYDGCYVWYEDGGATVEMNDWAEAGDKWFYEVSDGKGGTTYDDHKDVAHIILGHELIHATHHMNGTIANPLGTVYRYTSTGLMADIRGDLNMQEEYKTVGLFHVVAYPTHIGSITLPMFYIPWLGSLTENALRAEQGLSRRTAY